MSFLSESAVRTGPLNYLVGAQVSPVGRLGEVLRTSLESSSTTDRKPVHVCSTERLAARVRAGGADQVVVSSALDVGYLDLGLFDIGHQQLADVLQAAIGTIEEPVLLRSVNGWDVLLPLTSDLMTLALTSVPVTELDPVLDSVDAAGPTAVRLELTAEQVVCSAAALLTAPGTELDLRVAAGTGIDVIARLVGRRPRICLLDVRLDAGMITVAKASLLATIADRLERLSFSWDPADDEQVRATILPQIALAYRDIPAFHSWAADLERQLLLPFDILARETPVEAPRAIVATSIEAIPNGLIDTDLVIYAPLTGPDLGQRDVRFEGSALHNATAMLVGTNRLQLLPYSAPRPDGTDPLVRHIESDADLEEFLADARAARTVGSWADAAAELENDARFLDRAQTPSASIAAVLFCDSAGVRETRLLSATDSANPADAPWLGAYVTALRLRRRFGSEVEVSGFPGDPDAADGAVEQHRRWLVGRSGATAVLAEIGYRRRVFQVPEWLAGLVESVQDGFERDRAVRTAAELAGTTPADCERLLLQLAA